MTSKLTFRLFCLIALGLLATGCASDDEPMAPVPSDDAILAATFGENIDLANLANYANQPVPAYITKDNSGDNPITDTGATLGRVLFYDTLLSVNNTVSCASCHKQELAFSDLDQASTGVNGTTARHSMRLINARFSAEDNVFWNERASSLEEQASQPIQDHIEMGFSGEDGAPDLAEAMMRMGATDYYPILFEMAFGDPEVTEVRIQLALAQFVRSIQSFDSKYDEGRALVPGDNIPFPNFSPQEGQGKGLFMSPPEFIIQGIRSGGGLGCAGCHTPPEFDIDPATRNNGFIEVIGGVGSDITVTRSPSLRDVIRADGGSNGGLMHTGALDVEAVLEHYNLISQVDNPDLDSRLMSEGFPQSLGLTQANKNAVLAFLKTLAGTDVYTNPKWSDPFVVPEQSQ